MKIFYAGLLCLISLSAVAQDKEFEFGSVKIAELALSRYEPDTSAAAIVLQEYGDAEIQYRVDILLVYKHHVRLKILKPKGQEHADISIPLYKANDRVERLVNVKGSSFNIEDGLIRERKFNPKELFTETIDKNWEAKKFAIPNVRVGTVIEYEYEIETPFFFNFRTWYFQSDIPKIKSEYRATIPANWRYSIALRGPLQLVKNESDVLKDYFSVGAGKADCVRYNWAMENVPAFYEEEYMTSKYNFIAAINFELLQIEYFDGRKDKVTKEWKDVEHELKTSEKFGLQLRRGKDIIDEKIEEVIAHELDPVVKAEKIFSFIRSWYSWNEKTSKYTDIGIKKAFDSRKGNVGDINLSLIAALKYAGLNVEPMLLSTRDNGLPIELFPVLSDFNYVIAKLNIGDKVVLLDATDDFLPFGLLPERCINGKGRVLGEKESYWYEIKPANRAKRVTIANLVLSPDGKLKGNVTTTYTGYKGAQKRSAIYSETSLEEYIKELKSTENNFNIVDCSYSNLDDISKPLTETLTVELEEFQMNSAKSFFFNPTIYGRWTKNPFHLAERLYPVDFGVPMEETMVLTMEYPAELRVAELLPSLAISLPRNGGKFLFGMQVNGQKLTVSSTLMVTQTIFHSEEYPTLKEFFNRVVKAHGSDLVFETVGK
jgi:hypothetical protein